MTETKSAAHQAPEGLLLVDKPEGPTSHDVVAAARRLLNTRKVGHGGTLDPMATGVLVLGVGRATKLLTYISGSTKKYEATIRLGQSTDTDDAMGDVLESRGSQLGAEGLEAEAVVNEEAILNGMARLTGDIIQVPSTVSAIKVDGKRAYDLARKGEEVRLKGRPVTVSRFDLLGIREEEVDLSGEALRVVDLDVVADVSSGTYVRALARDLGEALGVGGHLTALRRTSVGDFQVGECAPLATLQALRKAGEPLPILSLSSAAKKLFPVIRVTDVAAEQRFRHGGAPRPFEVELLANGSVPAGGRASALERGSTGGSEPAVEREGNAGAVYAVTGADGEVLGLVRRTVQAGEPAYRTVNVFSAR